MTCPAGVVVDVCGVVVTENPAPWSVDFACDSGSPVTSGTATFGLPLETSSVTALPTSTDWPDDGSVPIALPEAYWSEFSYTTRPTFRPACLSICFAFARGRSVTDGTFTFPGPCE